MWHTNVQSAHFSFYFIFSVSVFFNFSNVKRIHALIIIIYKTPGGTYMLQMGNLVCQENYERYYILLLLYIY